MPKFLVCNYYTSSIIHEVEAEDEFAAVEIGRDLPDDMEELASSLVYDETVLVEGFKYS